MSETALPEPEHHRQKAEGPDCRKVEAQLVHRTAVSQNRTGMERDCS